MLSHKGVVGRHNEFSPLSSLSFPHCSMMVGWGKIMIFLRETMEKWVFPSISAQFFPLSNEGEVGGDNKFYPWISGGKSLSFFHYLPFDPWGIENKSLIFSYCLMRVGNEIYPLSHRGGVGRQCGKFSDFSTFSPPSYPHNEFFPYIMRLGWRETMGSFPIVSPPPPPMIFYHCLPLLFPSWWWGGWKQWEKINDISPLSPPTQPSWNNGWFFPNATWRWGRRRKWGKLIHFFLLTRPNPPPWDNEFIYIYIYMCVCVCEGRVGSEGQWGKLHLFSHEDEVDGDNEENSLWGEKMGKNHCGGR